MYVLKLEDLSSLLNANYAKFCKFYWILSFSRKFFL